MEESNQKSGWFQEVRVETDKVSGTCVFIVGNVLANEIPVDYPDSSLEDKLSQICRVMQKFGIYGIQVSTSE